MSILLTLTGGGSDSSFFLDLLTKSAILSAGGKNMAQKKMQKKQLSLFDLISKSTSARDQVKEMLSFRAADVEGKRLSHWRGIVALPPGSLAEVVVSEFQRKTNIPLELPFFTLLHWVAAYLLKHDVSLRLPGSEGVVKPDLWTVLLASSGAGKSWTQKRIYKSLEMGELAFPGGIASAAKFVQELAEHNKSIWIKDEFGQFLKALSNQTHLEEIKAYLLSLHDNETIERKTQKYSVTVEDAALVILGFTVWETFPEQVSAEDVLDGFAQRFSYIVAERDEKRAMIDYPIWNLNSESWKERWDTLVKKIAHPEYVISQGAMDGYKIAFSMLYNEQIPESFYRRLLWRAHKYALVYHILRGQGHQKELAAEDYGWAGRVLYLHVHDAMRLLDSHGLSDFEKVLRKTEALRDRFKEEGRVLKARDVVAGVRGVRSAQEAKAVLSIIDEK